MEGMARFFVEGGIWMIPIGFCSMLVVAVVIERCYNLFVIHRQDAMGLISQIRRAIEANQIDQAFKLCDAKPNSALSMLCKQALQQAGKSEDDIKLGVEEAVMEAVPAVQTRGHMLSGLASLATLLGLLGTVMGLIQAFTVVADAPPDQKSVLLTRAISVAMNCTAFGLMVAIPAMFFQLLFSGTIKKLVDDIDTSSMKLENLLISRRAQK